MSINYTESDSEADVDKSDQYAQHGELPSHHLSYLLHI